MRIIGGSLKGRVIKGPISGVTRPTSDRLRETIFDILINSFPQSIDGGQILDVFSGTGALAFEAISRGASGATLVDESRKAAALIRDNLISLNLEKKVRIIRRDARKLGASLAEVHDLAFLDPPYGEALMTPALTAIRDGGWLKPNALVVLEEAKTAEITFPDGFCHLQTRIYGGTKLVFAQMGAI